MREVKIAVFENMGFGPGGSAKFDVGVKNEEGRVALPASLKVRDIPPFLARAYARRLRGEFEKGGDKVEIETWRFVSTRPGKLERIKIETDEVEFVYLPPFLAGDEFS